MKKIYYGGDIITLDKECTAIVTQDSKVIECLVEAKV